MKRKRLNSMPMEDELSWVFLSPLQHDVKQIFYFYRMDKWYVDKILANIVSKEISNKNNFQILSKIQNKTKIVNSILGILNLISAFQVYIDYSSNECVSVPVFIGRTESSLERHWEIKLSQFPCTFSNIPPAGNFLNNFRNIHQDSVFRMYSVVFRGLYRTCPVV